nr:MAG TPA: hypothetical protein [Caudoviricetes sp.]
MTKNGVSFFHDFHGNLDPKNPNKMTILSATIF